MLLEYFSLILLFVFSLTYFYLKEGNIQNKTEAYINEYKKNVFERSNYFTVRKEKDPLLELNDVSNKIIERNRMNKTGFKLNQKMAKHIIKENPTLENDEDSSNCEMNTAPNVNNDHNISLINSNQNPNKIGIIIQLIVILRKVHILRIINQTLITQVLYQTQ